MNESYVIGVDIGGNNTVIGIVDNRGNILYRAQIKTGDYSTGENYVQALGNAINDLIAQSNLQGEVRGIGIGAPNGNMNNGTIEKAANIAWTKSGAVPIAKMLTETTGLKCKVSNDANAAAAGEMAYGVARGLKDFIVLTLGTGLGSGIVSNGQLIVGHDGSAGELGHSILVRNNGRPCGCGRSGCLETYASATGVARTAREFLELKTDESLLREINDRPITSKDVFLAAEKGDRLAIDIFDYTAKMLGLAICDFITFSSPQAIILFGGLAHAGKFLTEPLQKVISDNILYVYEGKTRILLSNLNDSEAAVLGASALAWE